jgi:hypothetical protein
VLDPNILAGTPFRNKTAYEDMIGTISTIHDGLIEAVSNLTQTSPAKYVLDANSPMDETLETIQSQSQALSRALGIDDPPDLQTFNLRDQSEWVSWTFVVAQDLNRIKIAAGVV